ncbi:F-box domain containing protein [Trema orientale]|uniref:F-box domain containing protein n=1 Tax=Trema orientale TaxID=63057 RepID=A0A2P5FCL1_TREOI|nr:F-box domain containing protein [Trema orientale]
MESNDENEHNRNRSQKKAHLSVSPGLGGLPSEVVFDILSRLPLTSLLQCKLVSQLYYSLVKYPWLTSMHLSRANDHNPFVVCFSDYPISKLYFVDLSSPENMFLARTPNFCFESTPPEFDIVGSCNGLLCLYYRFNHDPLFIFNPFTREYRALPNLFTPLHLRVLRVVFGFGFHPRIKKYKAIKIVYYRDGTEAIRMIEVYVHTLDIISFDLDTEEFQVISQPIGLGLNKFLNHLVTLNNCLSAVISSQFGENEIWVLKDYNVKESWTKELVIPDYVPQGFRMNCAPRGYRPNGTRKRAFRVLCNLKGGDEILFSHGDNCLVSFNPGCGEFKDIWTEGLPTEFETIVHVGSLISIAAAFAGHPTQHHLVA